MKKIYFSLFLFILNFSTFAQSAIITSIIDGTCNSGTHPRIIEIYIDGTMDVSGIHLQMQRPNLTVWLGSDNIGIGEYSNEFIYVVNDLDYFDAEYPGVATSNKTMGSIPAYFDGTSKVRIIDSNNNSVLDMYGIEEEDPTGTTWEYTNSYVQRKSGVFASNTFNQEDWTIYPVGTLDGKGSCNSSSQLYTSTPIGIYSPSPDKEALIALYNATDGPNWTNTWDLNADISTWYGVTVNAGNQVTEINLSYNNLSGNIPDEIGDLTNLQKLELRNNNLDGDLPTSITDLTLLEDLDLTRNKLTGNLPSNIDNMVSLKELSIVSNKFSGEIPPEIGLLPNLEAFWALSNELTGTIPSELGNLVNATKIDLRNNNLTGTIPESFVNLTNLEGIQVSDNNLSGIIPEFIWDMTWLTTLDIGSNDFTGVIIPPAIGNFASLGFLYLNDLDITGSLPAELWSLTNLIRLDISGLYNLDEWSIPNDISNLNKLTYIAVFNSNLTGEIPDVLDSFPDLLELDLSNNNLTGSIPPSLSSLTNLLHIRLQKNQLSGELPALNSSSMSNFRIESNNFVFEDFENIITDYTNNITNFEYTPQQKIDVEEELVIEEGSDYSITITSTSHPDNNYQWRKNGENIEGENESSISFTNITSSNSGVYDCIITNPTVPDLNLERNAVTLKIYSEADRNALLALYNATDGPNWTNTWDLNQPVSTWYGISLNSENRVRRINLSDNNLSGNIPESIRDLSHLEYLGLQHNNLTGNIPDGIGSLTNLTQIHLSSNNFTGNIPQSLENLMNLEYLYLSFNNLDGNIPEAIGNLTNLTRLMLRENNLEGNIPESIVNLTNLEYLYIENNALTGNIPAAIGSFTNLSALHIESNNFVFEDIEPILNSLNETVSITYTPQEYIDEVTSVSVISGNNFLIQTETTNSPNNTYQWRKQGNIIEGATDRTYTISSVSESDSGEYDCLINNTIVTDLTLYKNKITLAVIPDNDNDGINNDLDQCPDTPEGDDVNANGCSQSQLDDDNDGVNNDLDQCPDTAEGEDVNANGCSQSPLDDDNDGVNNDLDQCPDTPEGDDVDANGCSQSPLDDDNDGVNNDLDQCPDTPEGDDVDANGCSQSPLDDDNDGVNNDLDQCPDTPEGDDVDANGCSQSQLDDDNDGVTNNLDQCPNTPDGENVNFNGCSQSQLDDDKDGIMNDIDECPETPLGEIVNEKGCSQSDVLGNSPVQVVGISTTCPNTNNGEIIVDANNNVSNQIVVSGPNYNETFSGLSGSENVIITDLAPGIYNICVTYQGYEANYCSSVNIEETEELTSSKAQVDLQNKNASFYVSGSKHYEVLVNNILYKYNVDNTATTKIEVPLEAGINEVVLKTDKICQGEKRQTISFANLSFYPNPAEDYLNIAGLNEFTEIEVYITDLAGNRITSQVFDNSSSSLRIPLYNLSVGVYIVNIKTDTQTMNTKIYKK